jgi:hypothetical protein
LDNKGVAEIRRAIFYGIVDASASIAKSEDLGLILHLVPVVQQ